MADRLSLDDVHRSNACDNRRNSSDEASVHLTEIEMVFGPITAYAAPSLARFDP